MRASLASCRLFFRATRCGRISATLLQLEGAGGSDNGLCRRSQSLGGLWSSRERYRQLKDGIHITRGKGGKPATSYYRRNCSGSCAAIGAWRGPRTFCFLGAILTSRSSPGAAFRLPFGGCGGGSFQTRHRLYAAPFLCHSLARERDRYPHHPGPARPRPPLDDSALYVGLHRHDPVDGQSARSITTGGDAAGRLRPTFEVADIFRRHGSSYRRENAGHLGCAERRVMGAIEACRTPRLGRHVDACDDCGRARISYNSCRNRHCPKCCESATGFGR